MLRHGRGVEIDALGGWSVEPSIALALALLALLYALGVRAARPAARPVLWQRGSFGAGVALAFVALSSPTATLSDDLFVMHMAQHTLITNVAVPLVLLGSPLLPLGVLLPRSLRRAAVRPLLAGPLGWLVHLATRPLVAGALFVGTTLAWHVPAAYLAAVENDALHIAQHLSFIATAALFWGQVIDPVPFRSPLPLPARIAYVFAAGLPHHLVTSTLLILSERPLYATYVARSPAFGLSALSDQRLAGGVMAAVWFVVSLTAMSVLFFQWLAREEREQRAREGRAT